ncbi:hypothetical protein QJQ45_026980 [Haematococcus lacustris]|nr:hypothetical protein QJQ45_026980 [Haematococcus lacustris]
MKLIVQQALAELGQSSLSSLAAVRNMVANLRAGRPINVHLDQLVLFFSLLALQLLLVKVLSPSPWGLLAYSCWGLLLGAAVSVVYFYNKKRKREVCDVMGVNLGLKGLQHLLGSLPTWLSYTEREKVLWFNYVLEKVWPFYDKGVCKLVKTQTEAVFEQQLRSLKVPGLKSIAFKQLTFGDAPFRVESVLVSDKQQGGLVLELDLRWCGEANITLAIELSAGEFTKICPKVTDISFVGSLRVTLAPLVDRLPGFGAAVVTFRKPPRLKYRLDFGHALGGQYIAGVVKPFINHVIDNVLLNMLVWPQRLVVPVLPDEDMAVHVARLAYRSQGVLRVTVISAKELRKTDTFGSADPLVELSTDGKQVVSSRTIKNSLTPQWDETFWLLVQEPRSQELKVSVYDRDFFSAKVQAPPPLAARRLCCPLLQRSCLDRSPLHLVSATITIVRVTMHPPNLALHPPNFALLRTPANYSATSMRANGMSLLANAATASGSVSELLTLNIGQTFGAKELMGRCLVKLAPVTAAAPEPVTAWYHLGLGDWANPEGCGKGEGKVQLRCAYRSFDSFKREEPLTADTGIVIVRVITAEHLQRAPGRKNTAMTAYVRVKCGDDSASVPPLTSTANHTWTNANTLEFYDVKFSSNIKLKVMERALQDDSLGNLEVLVSDIADACDFNPLSGGREHGFMLRHFPLEDGGGARLTASLRFVPCC